MNIEMGRPDQSRAVTTTALTKRLTLRVTSRTRSSWHSLSDSLVAGRWQFSAQKMAQVSIRFQSQSCTPVPISVPSVLNIPALPLGVWSTLPMPAMAALLKRLMYTSYPSMAVSISVIHGLRPASLDSPPVGKEKPCGAKLASLV